MNSPFLKPSVLAAALATLCPAAESQDASRDDDPRMAALAINALGIDLLHQQPSRNANVLLSPYSIQTALVMAYAGSGGETRQEMASALHYPADEQALHSSLAALRRALEQVAAASAQRAADSKRFGGSSDPVELTTANRLFGQAGYEFRQPFLDRLAETHRAPFQLVDYRRDATGARLLINRWVEEQTRDRIRELLPPNALDAYTRLVLVNAVFFKAPWQSQFSERSTQPQPFRLAGGSSVDVPTMLNRTRYGYQRNEGFEVVVLPYSGGELQLLVLMPESPEDLSKLESALTPELFSLAAGARFQDIVLHLPKFKIEPPSMPLSQPLMALGMPTAFDRPVRSANFDRMAPRKLPDDYLFISEVFHKTFLELDEFGTEAAAATAVIMAAPTSAPVGPPPDPLEVRVDRPFVFAIQHRASGACLFLGRVFDPRA